MIRCATSLLLVLVLTACAQPPSTPTTNDLRIASLSPAITALLHELQLEHRLVGRSAFCRRVDAVPVVGDLAGANVEVLLRLAPTLLICQATSAPPPAGFEQAASRCSAASLKLAMDDMDDLHAAIDAIVVAVDPTNLNVDLAKRAAALHAQLKASLVQAPATQRRVLLLQGGPSMLAWGEHTWLGRIVKAAGGLPIPAEAGWRTLSAEDVTRLQPDVLLILSETPHQDPGPSALLETPARRMGRIHVVHHPDLFIPGVHAATMRPIIEAHVQQVDP